MYDCPTISPTIVCCMYAPAHCRPTYVCPSPETKAPQGSAAAPFGTANARGVGGAQSPSQEENSQAVVVSGVADTSAGTAVLSKLPSRTGRRGQGRGDDSAAQQKAG